MAESFVPRFKDLVRCYTSTVGTGDFALGPSLSGFSSFAEKLQPGDQFYYSCIGIDKPAEREVGRGTLVNATTIARQPTGGGATSFTKGNKTIALVAAGEWFNGIDQSVANLQGQVSTLAAEAGSKRIEAVQIAEDMAKLASLSHNDPAAILTEIGRDGAFRWDGSNLAALVAADGKRGLYVAPAADATGASGAWVRNIDGPINPEWFGIVRGAAGGANGPANSAAFKAMLTVLKARATFPGGYDRGTETIRFPSDATYEFAGDDDIVDCSIAIEGSGPVSQAFGTKLKFPAGKSGLRFQYFNTSGVSGTRADGQVSSHSMLRNIRIEGGYAGAESEHHGLVIRSHGIILENVWVSNFPGDGIYCATSTPYGNSNNCRIQGGGAQGCRDGLFIDGADANAWLIEGVDCSANRRWGVCDSSFLGNTYIACHTSANGWDGAIASTPTACTFGGNRYYVKAGQAAGASTNAPTGTSADNAWWGFIGAGDTYHGVVAWVSGTTFREGGGYKTEDANASNVFLNCYAEGDQNPSQFTSPTQILNGVGMGSRYGGRLSVAAGGLQADGGLTVRKELRALGSSDGTVMELGQANTGLPVDNFYIFNTSNGLNHLIFKSWYGGNQSIDATISSWLGGGLILDGKSSIYFRSNGLTVGTFGGSGLALAAGTIGYAAGAGGGVVQATDKSTGVTLNKASGQIQMSAAALAASAAASFVLTNGQIGASDTVIVNIAGGTAPGTHVASVDGVAAGACTITLRNISGGALSDAVVLNFTVLKGAAA